MWAFAQRSGRQGNQSLIRKRGAHRSINPESSQGRADEATLKTFAVFKANPRSFWIRATEVV